MDEFPDFSIPGFNKEVYNKRFKESNVIIHATAKEVFYPEHWGPVSIKCAFNGNEYYELNKCKYRVDDTGFLLLNEGQTYSSYIYSNNPVESFTLNFSSTFIKEVYTGWSQPEPGNALTNPPDFFERIYRHDSQVSRYIFLLKVLSKEFYSNKDRIEESYILLLRALFNLHQQETWQVQKVKAVKASTRKELHQRLMRAKDQIDSCFYEDISLDRLAAASHLNPVYLLRQFKARFGLTPRQYIIGKRLEVAKQLLLTTKLTITEICFNVGYKDLTSFCKLFRQFYHASPETYRLQYAPKKSIFTR